eukprot:359347-Chlamydomonas_euryale.AAC.3
MYGKVTIGDGVPTPHGASLAPGRCAARRVRTAATLRFDHATAPPAAADPAAPPTPTPPQHRKFRRRTVAEPGAASPEMAAPGCARDCPWASPQQAC